VTTTSGPAWWASAFGTIIDGAGAVWGACWLLRFMQIVQLYRFTNNTANHGSRDLERLASHRSLAH